MTHHKVVPNGSMKINPEVAERHTKQVNELIKRGSLPPSLSTKKRKKKSIQRLFEFVKNTLRDCFKFFF